ncbi:MAG TPA: 16S rRNA (adenine(1518)-N(6)/adenine(1519)-N(6))-dimethyltransferase RsmA [Candidatus Paceibacterota bacterium]
MKLKKSLGQNFLKSKSVVKTILDISSIKSDDVILEIGPGEGFMTEELLKVSDKVISVEKDDRLIPVLREKFKETNLEIIHEDVLSLDLSKVPKPYKVIANIPYYITGQILRKFLESNFQPISMTIMVQKEVAERVIAKNNKESLLSLSVKIFGNPIYIKTVKKSLFKPAPKVDSAILYIKNIGKNKLFEINEELFFKIIHAGFAHKRKLLLSNLSSIFPKTNILESFKNSDINEKTRAEDLTLEDWVKICKKLNENYVSNE